MADPTAKPTIAHVLHGLNYAGAEVLAANLARKLKHKYRFTFFCLDEVGPLGEQLQNEGFDVVELGRRAGVDWAVAKLIARLVKRQNIDLFHAHQYTPFFYTAASRGWNPLNRLARPPILFTEHGRHYPDSRRPKRIWANKVLLRGRDRITAVGEFVKQALVTNEGLPAKRIQVVHNGIDPDGFEASDGLAGESRQKRKLAIREALGLKQDQPVLLQVARFHSVKDHATAVRAFAMTRRKLPDAVLLFAGDGEERPAMEKLARQLKLGDAVQFLGVRTDVARLMVAADLFVLSSLSEGISVTLLEAMASRLPIVATEVGGNGEVVEHEHTGLLSPRQQPEPMARNMIRLLQDRVLRMQMGLNGRERLLKHFAEADMHRRYDFIYGDMTGLNQAVMERAFRGEEPEEEEAPSKPKRPASGSSPSSRRRFN